MNRVVFMLMLLALGVLLARAQSVNILWDRNPTNENVTGYEVGIGFTAGSYATITNAGDVTEARVPSSGQTFYAVRAYDAGGLRSAWSSEVVFTPGGTPQFYLGIQPATMTGTSAPPVVPPGFAPVPGYQITAEMRRFVGGPVVASVRLFVEEGGTGYATMRAIATNDVPKSAPFTTQPRKSISIMPPAPAVAAPVTAKKFLPTKNAKGGGR